jgi:hypothetical protein
MVDVLRQGAEPDLAVAEQRRHRTSGREVGGWSRWALETGRIKP